MRRAKEVYRSPGVDVLTAGPHCSKQRLEVVHSALVQPMMSGHAFLLPERQVFVASPMSSVEKGSLAALRTTRSASTKRA